MVNRSTLYWCLCPNKPTVYTQQITFECGQSLRFFGDSQSEQSVTPAAVRQTCCIWMAAGQPASQPAPLTEALSQLFSQRDPPALIFRITAAAVSSQRISSNLTGYSINDSWNDKIPSPPEVATLPVVWECDAFLWRPNRTSKGHVRTCLVGDDPKDSEVTHYVLFLHPDYFVRAPQPMDFGLLSTDIIKGLSDSDVGSWLSLCVLL